MNFQKKLLAASISSCMLASAGASAQQTPEVEEVVVMGVRGAQESAVLTKRDANSLVDGIAAEDIGKLPDVTISDSLQRIPGVQIRRSAGEGGAINIRGLPQVVSQLNGEQYLGASSVTSIQPNFGDIPSQLFKGADVYKSSVTNLGPTGISGTVNLKTHRPFDMDDGMTMAGSAEFQQGSETRETDPVLSGLFNWKEDGMGFLASVAYANVNLANYYNGLNSSNPSGDAGWVNGVNDWAGAAADLKDNEYISSQGWAAWHQVTERERLGFNASFQAELGEGFEFIADAFHTDQEEYNRKVGMSATNRWQTLDWFTPTNTRGTGFTQARSFDDGDTNLEWITYGGADLDVLRLKSFTQNDSFHNTSNNFNLELRYDNGGALTGSVRYIKGSATSERRHGYNEGDLTDWSDTNFFSLDTFYPSSVCDEAGIPSGDRVGDEGGCFMSPNPDGYAYNPQLSVDFTGSHPVWSGFDDAIGGGGLGADASARDYMANLQSYAVGAFSSENNSDSKGNLDAFRTDGQYKFDDGFVTSVELGLRLSRHAVDHTAYHLFSPFYAGTTYTEEGCYAQWKAVDIALESDICRAGELTGPDPETDFQAYTALPPTELDDHNNIIWVNDFGPVSGVPGVWAVDPADYDDPEAFHNRVFGSTRKAIIPGSSYNLDRDEFSYYVQGNFESGIVSGNLGVRVVETDLAIKQNETGATLPHGNTNVDTGDVLTKRSFTEVLPSLNVSLDIQEDLKLRFAAGKTMTPLDLNQWGAGLAVSTVNNQTDGDGIPNGTFTVSSASLNGNPNLEPWKATNLDLSLEWYLATASMVSAAVFQIDIDSFTKAGTIPLEIPDSDGVLRRTTLASTQVQGEGGSLEGMELAAKLALSDVVDSGFLSNFGVDANYTYSPSEQNSYDVQGNKNPFPDNSEEQINFIAWFQGERLQTRIAYNYRTDRLVSSGITSAGLNLYQAPTAYLDISASYDLTNEITVYLNGSNVTGEYEDYYIEVEDQYAFQNYYESRYTLGVRARF